MRPSQIVQGFFQFFAKYYVTLGFVTLNIKKEYFWICLGFILFTAASLRFWNIGALQLLVFDEVYFPKYAYDFLTDVYYFDVHPPLSKYLIGIGIWLYNHMPWVNDPAIGTVPIEQLNAISWRWLNAVTGTAICFVGALFALTLSKNRIFALIVAIFLAIDGALIVESRFGMNNVYILFFGMGGLWCLALAIKATQHHRRLLILSGILLGLTYSVKWNGLGYSLVAWSLVFAGGLSVILIRKNLLFFKNANEPTKKALLKKDSLFNVVELWEFPIFLVAIPFAVYVLVWQPHLNQYDKYGFFGMQKQIMGYHSNSVEANEHPYCSKWYTWPLMKRPVGFHFKSTDAQTTKPGDEVKKIYEDIHLFGNPALFILSFIAVLYMLVALILQMWRWRKTGELVHDFTAQSFIVVGFFANWLPWMMVSRCLFLYHYLPAAAFSFMALAWVIKDLYAKNENWSKALAGALLCLIAFAFFYWLPFSLGLSLPASSFYDRMWFKSWI